MNTKMIKDWCMYLTKAVRGNAKVALTKCVQKYGQNGFAATIELIRSTTTREDKSKSQIVMMLIIEFMDIDGDNYMSTLSLRCSLAKLLCTMGPTILFGILDKSDAEHSCPHPFS